MKLRSQPDKQDERLIVVVRRVSFPEGLADSGQRVAFLRTAALAALSEAALARGAELGTLKKDERDAPLPSNGWYWSISHTSHGEVGLVAACVSRTPVGVDAESVRTARAEVMASVLSPRERALFTTCGDVLAFTFAWVAKEAVLKKLGMGLMALSEVRIEDASGDACVVERDGVRHPVETRGYHPFLVAVSGRAREGVEWTSDEPRTEPAQEGP
jgi:4'-phosphopantetheinyl transferase